MGYLTSEWVDKFCKGKIIRSIESENGIFGSTRIVFSDGTFLQLIPYMSKDQKKCGCFTDKATIIVNPYRWDGSVIQSTEIMKEEDNA